MSNETQEPSAPPPYHAVEEAQEEETMTNQYNPAGLPVPTDHDLKQVHSSPSTGSARRMLQRRKKRKDDSLSDVIRSWLVEHQIGMLNPPVVTTTTRVQNEANYRYTQDILTNASFRHHQASPSTSSSSTPSPISSFPASAPAPAPSSASPTTTPTRARTGADQTIFTLSHTGLSSLRG